MHGVGTELDRVPALVPYDIVVEFKVAVVAKREQSRIAHRRELAAEGVIVDRITKHIASDPFSGVTFHPATPADFEELFALQRELLAEAPSPRTG